MEWNYQEIKRTAKEEGGVVTDFLVLARHSDTFYSGSPGNITGAEWFAALWNHWGGGHIRRIHYKTQATGNIKKPDGSIYQNTQSDWGYLCKVAKHARYLGYLKPEQFTDKRNDKPIIMANYQGGDIEPEYDFSEDDFSLPAIRLLHNYIAIGEPEVTGYEYRQDDQKYHVEIWIEKSTMDDELIPICQKYGVNLLVGAGYTSITRCNEFLKRVMDSGKPARIFYISDYDPAGHTMPIQVSRQIQYWIQDYPGLDVKLNPLVLTEEQADRYADLPRTPIKDEDLCKRTWEELRGKGSIELDALESIYPGEFEKIVTEAVSQYIDINLSDEISEAGTEAQDMVTEEWEAAIEPYADEFVNINSEVDAIVDDYNKKLKDLAEELEEKLKPYTERLGAVTHEIQSEKDTFGVELPGRPEAEVDPFDEDDWLFDSNREYIEQLEVYKDHQES